MEVPHKGMQDKTIKKVLDSKIEDWLLSIKDENIQQIARDNVIVTGGSIASLIMGTKVKDYDVYLRTKQAVIAVANYYTKEFSLNNPQAPSIEVREESLVNIKGETEERVVLWIKSSGFVKDETFITDEEQDEDSNDPDYEVTEVEENDKYRPVYISENAITLSNKIQIVTRFYGEPDKIHQNYDFIHACCYYDYKNYKLHTPTEALRSMQSMTLRYTGSLYPVCSLFRLRKFISRGWAVSAGDILKMALQISEIDLKDIRVLREQTTGVDATYFYMFLNAIGEKDNITVAFLTEILDRIFYQNERDRREDIS